MWGAPLHDRLSDECHHHRQLSQIQERCRADQPGQVVEHHTAKRNEDHSKIYRASRKKVQ